ncbi:MAG: hypothetical protein RBR42_05050 [Desulfomicrobium sp.]|nr:hypothetical protein [Desulfomicrobium sp.]
MADGIKIHVRDHMAIGALFDDFSDAATDALARTGDHFFEVLQDRVAAHTQTGAMARSLVSKFDTDKLEYNIWHDLEKAPHALFVHWGTKPHEIWARNKQALRFPMGDKFIFAKKVNHPGYKGDPYFVEEVTDDAVFAKFEEYFDLED